MTSSANTHDLHGALDECLPWLLDLARVLARDEDEACDLVQDTVLVALSRPPSLERPLMPWLATILRRKSVDRLRRRSRMRPGEEAGAEEPSLPGAVEVAERLELHRQLTDALCKLEEPYRTAVTLRHQDRLSPRDIAERLDVPAGTVRWRISEGLRRLRSQLDRRYGSRQAWALLALPLGPGQVATPLEVPSGTGSATVLNPEVACPRRLGLLHLVSSWGAVPIVLLFALLCLYPWSEAWRADPEPVPVPGPSAAVTEAETETHSSLLVRAPSERHPVPRPLPDAADRDHAALSEPQLPAGNGWLEGRVLDLHGVPVPGCEVRVVSALPVPLHPSSPGTGPRPVLGVSHTDARGHFEVRQLPARSLQAFATGPAGTTAVSGPLLPGAAGAPGRCELRLRLAAAVGEAGQPAPQTPREDLEVRVSGRLVLEGGGPPSGYRVRLLRSVAPNQVALCGGLPVHWLELEDTSAREGSLAGADGRFELVAKAPPDRGLGVEILDGVGASRGVVTVEGPDLGPQDLGDLVVRPPARLSGRILQDLHESVPPRFLCLSNGDGRLRVAALDEGGSFRMAHLPPGRHVWRTTVEDPRMAGADELLLFEGVPGDLTWASLLLRPGREEHLEVNRAELPELRVSLLLDGAPPEGWQVRLVLPGPMAGVSSGGPLIVPLDRLGRASIRLDGVGVHGVTLSRTGLAVLGPECSWEFGIGDAGGEDGRADRELVLELTTCRVAGILTALPDRPLWLVTELPSGATWRAPLEVTPDGQFHAAQAMPGKARLVAGPVVSGWSEPEVDLASELTLATLVVPPEGIFDLTLSLDFETSR